MKAPLGSFYVCCDDDLFGLLCCYDSTEDRHFRPETIDADEDPGAQCIDAQTDGGHH